MGKGWTRFRRLCLSPVTGSVVSGIFFIHCSFRSGWELKTRKSSWPCRDSFMPSPSTRFSDVREETFWNAVAQEVFFLGKPLITQRHNVFQGLFLFLVLFLFLFYSLCPLFGQPGLRLTPILLQRVSMLGNPKLRPTSHQSLHPPFCIFNLFFIPSHDYQKFESFVLLLNPFDAPRPQHMLLRSCCFQDPRATDHGISRGKFCLFSIHSRREDWSVRSRRRFEKGAVLYTHSKFRWTIVLVLAHISSVGMGLTFCVNDLGSSWGHTMRRSRGPFTSSVIILCWLDGSGSTPYTVCASNFDLLALQKMIEVFHQQWLSCFLFSLSPAWQQGNSIRLTSSAFFMENLRDTQIMPLFLCRFDLAAYRPWIVFENQPWAFLFCLILASRGHVKRVGCI